MPITKDSEALSKVKAALPSDAQMASTSPYTEEKDAQTKPGPRIGKGSSNPLIRQKKEIEELKSKLSQAQQASKRRSESIPTLFVGEDSIKLEFPVHGAVHSAVYSVPVIEQAEKLLKDLQPVLLPVVSILNSALKARAIEETNFFQTIDVNGRKKKVPAVDQDKCPVVRATALTRARYAYQVLFENREVVKAIHNLGSACAKAFEGKTAVRDVRTAAYTREGNKVIPNPILQDALVEQTLLTNAQEIVQIQSETNSKTPTE